MDLHLDRLLNLAPLSRLRQVVFAAAGRQHLLRFDRTRPDRAQLRALLGLVHRARATPFGRDHDFSRIRSPADFRRLVPLRWPGELAREYPGAEQTWPAGSLAQVGCQRRVLTTTLALVMAARPRARLLEGRLLWLGDGTRLSRLEPDAVAHWFPLLVRPSLRVVRSVVGLGREPVSCLIGSPGRVAAFLEWMKDERENDRPFPDLTAILCNRQPGAPVEVLRQAVGPKVLLLQSIQQPGATLAVEDPRLALRYGVPTPCGGARLLHDHGAYFEFVPADLAGRLHPPRLGVGEVRPGVPYEVAITSPAGWWACRSGLVVAFEKLVPPLLRVVEGTVAPAAEQAGPVTARLPHPQSAGSQAAPQGTSVRTPWSVPADRG
jgi:hypothetical protein